MQRLREEKGFSAWHLVLFFLAAVAVCAVFFSLGYVVGFNQRPEKTSTLSETVTPSTNIPPTVNPPSESSSSAGGVTTETLTPTPAAAPPVVQPQPVAPAIPEQKTRVAQESVTSSKPRSSAGRRPSIPKEAPSEEAAAPRQNGRFAVQVIAAKTHAGASKMARVLEARHYHVFIVSPKGTHSGDSLYRVRVGPYASRSQAERVARKLKGEGFKAFVVH
jgi:DedD protein